MDTKSSKARKVTVLGWIATHARQIIGTLIFVAFATVFVIGYTYP